MPWLMCREDMFDGFDTEQIDVGDATINLRHGGQGPPLLLLHGHPQTHITWHRVAPRLAEHFTLVIPDLRGHGASVGPADPETAEYSNRAMADDMVEVMAELGYDSYRLAGHDRGGRVAYRYTLDHPERISQLATLDIVPTLEMAERMDYRLARRMFHWLFLAQPHPLPETVITADPDYYVDHMVGRWLGSDGVIDPDAMDAYRRAFRDERVVRAACEDYRAGLSIDLDHDRTSRDAGATIDVPMLAIWGTEGTLPFDPLTIWETWATSVRGRPIDCGHFVMEEAPAETADALISFFQ